MKQIITYLLIILAFSCNKKNQVQPTSTTPTTVYCFYQMDFGNKAFYYCAKSLDEKIAKEQECIDNGLNIKIEQKSNCSECQ